MNSEKNSDSAIQVITATQFLIMAMGAAVMNLHLRIVGEHSATNLELFLAQRALWLLFIPLLWRGFAECSKRFTFAFARRVTIVIGQAMIVAMIATYVYAIYGKG